MNEKLKDTANINWILNISNWMLLSMNIGTKISAKKDHNTIGSKYFEILVAIISAKHK
jgi:hypothetical protein